MAGQVRDTRSRGRHSYPRVRTPVACPRGCNPALTLTVALTLSCALPAAAQDQGLIQQNQLLEQMGSEQSTYDVNLERDALEKLAMLKGRQSPEYRLAALNSLLREGSKGREQATELATAICQDSPNSFYCRQAQGKLLVSSTQMRLKLQPFVMYETNSDYENAVKAMEEVFQGPPPEQDLKRRYYEMLGQVEGREAEAAAGLEAMLKEDPDNPKLQAVTATVRDIRAQALAREGLDLIDNPQGINRGQALLNEALKQSPNHPDADYWRKMLAQSSYYQKLKDADKLLDAGNHPKALQEYVKASSLNPQSPYAYVGAARCAAALDNLPALERYSGLAYKAAAQESPRERNRIRALLPVLKAQLLRDRAQKAQEAGEQEQAFSLLEQALSLDPDNPWERYALSKAYREQGQREKSRALFESMPQSELRSFPYARAYAAYLHGEDKLQEAIEVLKPYQGHDNDVDLDIASFQNELTVSRARSLYALGKREQATELLQDNTTPEAISTKAYWALLEQRYKEAAHAYEMLLQQEGDNPRYLMGLAEAQSLLGEHESALKNLKAAQKSPELKQDPSYYRTAAGILDRAGQGEKALTLMQEAIAKLSSAGTQEELREQAWLLRDYARLRESRNESRAQTLEVLAQALQRFDGQAEPYKNKAEFTRQLRTPAASASPNSQGQSADPEQTQTAQNSQSRPPQNKAEEEHWLRSSIRREAASLYRRNNLVLTGGLKFLRDSGHSGYSDTRGYNAIMNFKFPLGSGRAQVQTDTYYLNAGRMRGGAYNDMYGSCFAAGCSVNQRHAATHTAVTFAWSNDKYYFDIGSAPRVKNRASRSRTKMTDLVFKLGRNFETDNFSFSAQLYRRAKYNSYLTYYGDYDEQTGRAFGAVKAQGLRGSLSHSFTRDFGLWAVGYAEYLSGHNVKDNRSLRLLSGLYYHLINEPHEQLTLGGSLMYMHYAYDLSGYTLGQGGYYSPQQYLSAAVSAAWRKRSERWSYETSLSLSESISRTEGIDRYPLKGLIPQDLSDYDARSDSSSDTSFGISLRALAEYRLTDNLFVGGEFSLTKSPDYSPNQLLLYFKYSFDPWLGDLDLPPEPPVTALDW